MPSDGMLCRGGSLLPMWLQRLVLTSSELYILGIGI